ncbi:ligase-associated DNA damage response endonuclease PdeM [Zhouia sp. PK063]|uniref:ligase-associated DNA damage response endonuclease PdeM n=1 Tax=Zhouia sp. PK063 TaxID=3373602 RepID=UPI003798B70A
MTETFFVDNQEFTLHCTGAAFWKQKQILLIADVHLGKTVHFRKHGIALPEQMVYKNYQQLDAVIHYFHPKHIYFLGDLFHSTHNSEWQLFEDWVALQSAHITLVIGNHDIIAAHKFETLGISLTHDILEEPFYFTHHPEEKKDFFNCCGHIHPGITLKGLGKQIIKLPCFVKKEHQLILPAFGEFTGNYSITPTEKDQIFVVTPDDVIMVAGS